MLKIKDNVDLKVLEKYGLKKLNIITECYDKIENVYCYVYGDDEKHIKKNWVCSYWVQFYINEKNKFKIGAYPNSLYLDEIADIVYDLIQDRLIEKVE